MLFACSPHRCASLLAVRVRRRSCRDCRHQSARGSLDTELVLLGGTTSVVVPESVLHCSGATSFCRQHSHFHRECCATFPSFSVCRRVSFQLFGLWFNFVLFLNCDRHFQLTFCGLLKCKDSVFFFFARMMVLAVFFFCHG